jgi:hypothetical protein
MKQRKFKLIKEYPGSGELGKILTNESEGIESWPEYWEEIKDEPILITEDGKELFEGDEFWSVDKRDWKLRKERAANKAGDCYFWDFSSKELAEKWLSENKPKWSNKDMIKFYYDYLLFLRKEHYTNEYPLPPGQYLENWEKEKC